MTTGIFPKGIEQLVVKLQDELVPHRLPIGPPTWFDWQSLPLSSFYAGMAAIRRKLGPGRHKFVDVGSGIGTKLFLADSMGFEPYGIERRVEYVHVSERLFPDYKIWWGDALDFPEYNQFDVIYSFRLAQQDDVQKKINDHIVANMKEGAVFFTSDSAGSLDNLKGAEEL